jgi:hypothetical protein
MNTRSVHSAIVPDDFVLTATASVAASSANDDFGIIFGWQDASNYYYAHFSEINNNTSNGIFKVQSGVQTQLADITSFIVPGTTYTIRIERAASSIKVYRNGALQASANDAGFFDGRIGFGTKSDRATFDNLRVDTARIVQRFMTAEPNPPMFDVDGTWGVVNGAYEITTASTASTTHLNNRSFHSWTVLGDFTLTADAKAYATSSTSDDFAIIFGWQDPDNYYFASFAESNTSAQSGIFRVLNGTSTQLADITSLITAGTTYNIRVERVGSSIKVYRNGTLQASATDSTFKSGRYAFGARSNRASFDNLIVY